VYAAFGLALLAVLTAVAFSTRQPPPPTIAEFAPNAIEKIEEAPDEQTSNVGDANGGCAQSRLDCFGPTPTPTPSFNKPPPIDVPRVRKCVGDPPRQIEDPQSPPCVPYWEGDNGGATSKGVTATEIRIAAPTDIENPGDAARFFNARFQLYGRKFVVFKTPEPSDCDDPATVRAAAEAVDELNIFAANQACGGSIGGWAYSAELARRHIIYAAHESPFDSTWTRRLHPYTWQYPMEGDAMFAHLGEWACKRLAGGIARHSPDPFLHNKPRVFGVIIDEMDPNHPISHAELTDRLKKCGATPKLIRRDTGQDQAANVILQMKNAKVTSIFCLCFVLDEAVYGRAATAQAYFPEWLISSYDLNQHNFMMKIGFPAEQREQLFGLSMVPMQVGTADWPGTWACNEIQCSAGKDLAAIGGYHSMLLIASAVQMAGPNLTPETFAEGLRKTIFPNPDHPIIAGEVGFAPIVTPDPKFSLQANMAHGMTADGMEFWWSESSTGPNNEEGQGAMCYVARKRYHLGEYPEGDDRVFFRGRCDPGGV